MDDSRVHTLTSDQFQQSIHKFLYKNGFTDVVKTQLRHGVISALSSSSTARCKQEASSSKSYDIYDLALHSLVLDHFECMGFQKVMSIFLPECGLNEKSMLSWQHALKVFGITCGHPLYDSIHTLGHTTDKQNKSTLSCLLSSCSLLSIDPYSDLIGRNRSTASVQTDDEITNHKTFKARVELDRQFKHIESKFASSFTNSAHLQCDHNIEHKVQLIRYEYERKLKQQVAIEMEKFIEEALSKIKIEESLKTQKEIERIRIEIQSNYESRLQKERDALEKKLRQGAFEQQLMELENHNSRKQLISEMDHMKRCESERLKSMEVQKHELDLEVDKTRQQMRIAQELIETAEAKELEMKTLVSMEYDRVHGEVTKNYLAATEAVRRQSEFYSKELSALSKQRNLLSQAMSQPLNPSKFIPKPIMSCETAIQTEDPGLLDDLSRDVANSNPSQDHGQVYEQEFKMLQLKYMAEKKGYDEGRTKLCHELMDTQKHLDECTHFNDKLKTERDLALQEVNELRRLLSISRSALACIHEPPSNSSIHVTPVVPPLHHESGLKIPTDRNVDPYKPFARSYDHSTTRFQPTRHETNLELNYQYTNHDFPSEEYITLKKSEALLRMDTYPDTVFVCEQTVPEPIIPEASGADSNGAAVDTLKEVERGDHVSAKVSSPSSDGILDYGSCEFDEESEM